MSPTLEILVRVPILVFHLDIRSRRAVPEGLQVSGQTDLTVLLEVAAEGILSSGQHAILCIPPMCPSNIHEKAKIVERKRTRVPARRPYE